jgi:vacuolar-type H+-ATPase subunit H
MCALSVTGVPQDTATPLLEIIRRKEAEVKRRLAGEREAAEAALAQAKQQAREIIAAAEAAGQRTGQDQYRAIMAEADRESESLVAQARAEAQCLLQVGQEQMETAIARAIQVIVDV